MVEVLSLFIRPLLQFHSPILYPFLLLPFVIFTILLFDKLPLDHDGKGVAVIEGGGGGCGHDRTVVFLELLGLRVGIFKAASFMSENFAVYIIPLAIGIFHSRLVFYTRVLYL